MILAAADQAAEGPSFAFWAPIIIAVISGAAAISVSAWNTRGESSALRRLKAMNEVIAGLPQGEPVQIGFSAARDVLAERVASRITGPSIWSKIRAWALGVLLGVSIVALVWGVSQLAPQLSVWSEDITLAIAAAIGTIVAAFVAASSTWLTFRQRRITAEAEAEVERAIAEMLTRYRAAADE